MEKLLLKIWPVVFVLLLLSILIAYFIIISYPENFKVDMSPLLSNVLNFGLSAFLTFYIAKIGFEKDNEKNQKKIAKVSIRNIRNNSRQLGYLIIKCDNLLVKDKPVSIESLESIREQMENVLRQIINSEEDFKDLVNEEYQREFDIIAQIIEARNALSNKVDQYKILLNQFEESKKLLIDKDVISEEKFNSMTKQLEEMAKEIRLLKAKETRISNTLPLGLPVIDSNNNYRIDGTQVKKSSAEPSTSYIESLNDYLERIKKKD